MSVSVNEVLLVGTLSREVEVSFSDNGTQVARTTLCLSEERDGVTYHTFVNLEAYHKSADALGACSPGALVLIKGKLKWKGLGLDAAGKKTGRLEVFCWSVQGLTADLPKPAHCTTAPSPGE